MALRIKIKKRITAISLLLILLIFTTACAPGSIAFSSQIYNVSTANYKKHSNPDTYKYIKSISELQDYYDENNNDNGLKNMKEKVLDNKKYNDEFFKNNCLLIIYHLNTVVFNPGNRVKSVVLKDDTINVEIYRGSDGAWDTLVTEYQIVIELNTKYAGKEVKTTYS